MSKSRKKPDIFFLKISEIEKLDFTKGKLKKEADKIAKENEQIMESAKVDVESLNKIRFEI